MTIPPIRIARFRLAATLAAIVCLATASASLDWQETDLDFHPPAGQTSVTGTYHFTNNGDRPVTITKVKTSCGCTTTELEKETYAPGESGSISATLKLSNTAGKRKKHITVYTDEGERRPYVLSIAAEAKVAVTVQPRVVFWRDREAAEAKSFKILVRQDEPMQVASVAKSMERPVNAFDMKLETVEEGREYRLVVTPAVGIDQMATTQYTITMKGGDAPASTYHVYARILAPPPETDQQ